MNNKNFNLTIYFTALLVLSYSFNYIDSKLFYSLFVLKSNIPGAYQIWQFITYVGFIQSTNIFFAFINVLFFYWVSSSIEGIWGSFKLFLFIFLMIVFKSIASFFLGILPLEDGYHIIQCILIAIGFNFPDRVIYLFFFIPVKIKYIGYFTLGLVLITTFFSLIYGVSQFLSILSGYLPILLFFKLVFATGDLSVKQIFKRQFDKNTRIILNLTNKNPEKNLDQKMILRDDDNLKIINVQPQNMNMCDPIDFERDGEYCKKCINYSKCINRDDSK